MIKSTWPCRTQKDAFFLHEEEKKTYKRHHISEKYAYKYTDIHYLRSKFQSVTVTVWLI